MEDMKMSSDDNSTKYDIPTANHIRLEANKCGCVYTSKLVKEVIITVNALTTDQIGCSNYLLHTLAYTVSCMCRTVLIGHCNHCCFMMINTAASTTATVVVLLFDT
jgi:hypothetical protein